MHQIYLNLPNLEHTKVNKFQPNIFFYKHCIPYDPNWKGPDEYNEEEEEVWSDDASDDSDKLSEDGDNNKLVAETSESGSESESKSGSESESESKSDSESKSGSESESESKSGSESKSETDHESESESDYVAEHGVYNYDQDVAKKQFKKYNTKMLEALEALKKYKGGAVFKAPK